MRVYDEKMGTLGWEPLDGNPREGSEIFLLFFNPHTE